MLVLCARSSNDLTRESANQIQPRLFNVKKTAASTVLNLLNSAQSGCTNDDDDDDDSNEDDSK